MAGISRAERERRAAAHIAGNDEPDHEPVEQSVALVVMVRDVGQFPPPHVAYVHPLEVDNYRTGGWRVKE